MALKVKAVFLEDANDEPVVPVTTDKQVLTKEGQSTLEVDMQNINRKIEERVLRSELVEVEQRIDGIITSPVEGISEQEILDARQGHQSLGANLTSIKNTIVEYKSKELGEEHILRELTPEIKDERNGEDGVIKYVSNPLIVDGSLVKTSYIAGSHRRVELKPQINVKPNGVGVGENSEMKFLSGTYSDVTTKVGYCYISASGTINFSVPIPSTGNTADVINYLDSDPITLYYQLDQPETVPYPDKPTPNTIEILNLISKVNNSPELSNSIDIPTLIDFGVWEPNFTTNDYAIPASGGSLSIKYNDFLAEFYDLYVGAHDGYIVNKKSLGSDSSKLGYELFEYDFKPKHYTHTVLISAGMNASEPSAIFGLAYFIKHVMEKTEDGFSFIHDNVRIKVIPIICPWSFDQSPLKYTNFNNVNINRNFNHLGSWQEMATGGGYNNKGDYPDSEAETKILKRWLSENGNEADLWIDCHSMKGSGNPDTLHYVVTANQEIIPKIRAAQRLMTDYYIDKGFLNEGDVSNSGTHLIGLKNYPKHKYVEDIYKFPSIMIEQKIDSTYYGGDPELDNDDGDIRNYLSMLRLFILAALDKNEFKFEGNDLLYYVYQLKKTNG